MRFKIRALHRKPENKKSKALIAPKLSNAFKYNNYCENETNNKLSNHNLFPFYLIAEMEYLYTK